ncbi:MAG: hypothetical protein HWD59_01200 [Coxiellaceae bacterium]|nr:MAG: hypothetical protein HWD59_01200 [Coxiellaceae bacterium]
MSSAQQQTTAAPTLAMTTTSDLPDQAKTDATKSYGHRTWLLRQYPQP